MKANLAKTINNRNLIGLLGQPKKQPNTKCILMDAVYFSEGPTHTQSPSMREVIVTGDDDFLSSLIRGQTESHTKTHNSLQFCLISLCAFVCFVTHLLSRLEQTFLFCFFSFLCLQTCVFFSLLCYSTQHSSFHELSSFCVVVL